MRVTPRSALACRGFTLVELLVALFIAAIMFALGYGALSQGLRDRDLIAEQQARVTAVQTAVRVMTQDFAQLTPRPVRDRVGNGIEPSLLSSPGAAQVAALTRTGWANPAGIQRPALQRVVYLYENGRLVRNHWRVLDATLSAQPVRRELLDRVRAVQLRYMDESRNWRDQWPPPEAGAVQAQPLRALQMRPLAVEITLDLEDWGRVVRIIEVAG